MVTILTFGVEGMNCGSCAEYITTTLGEPAFHDAVVSLKCTFEDKELVIWLQPTADTESIRTDVLERLVKMGFGRSTKSTLNLPSAAVTTFVFAIGGMNCDSCSNYINTTLGEPMFHDSVSHLNCTFSEGELVICLNNDGHWDPKPFEDDVTARLTKMGFTCEFKSKITPIDIPKPTSAAVAAPATLSLTQQHTLHAFAVEGMSCGSCAEYITTTLGEPPFHSGITSVRCSYDTKELVVYSDGTYEKKLLVADVKTRMSKLGFTASYKEPTTQFVFHVDGMNCDSCAEYITTTLGNPPFHSAVVSVNCTFDTKELVVDTDGSWDKDQLIPDVVARMTKMKFTAKYKPPAYSVIFNVEGMNCDSCAEYINTTLGDPIFHDRALGVNCMFDTKELTVRMGAEKLGQGEWHEGEFHAAVVEKMKKLGFTATYKKTIPPTAAALRATTSVHSTGAVRPAASSTSLLPPPPLVSAPRLRGLSTASSTGANDKDVMSQFLCTGMSCASCALKIEAVVSRLAGVQGCAVNFTTTIAKVKYNQKILDDAAIVASIQKLGFGAQAADTNSSEYQQNLVTNLQRDKEIRFYRTNFIFSCIFTVPLVIEHLILMPASQGVHDFVDKSYVVGNLQWGPFIDVWLALPVLTYFSRGFWVGAFKSLRSKNANMDVLVVMGISSALFGSLFYMFGTATGWLAKAEYYFLASASLVSFMLLGKFLENLAKKKTCEALIGLMDLAPKRGLLVRGFGTKNQTEKLVEVEFVKKFDVLKVSAGDKVPVDGVVLDGHGSVDESMVTGESVPVSKQRDDPVTGGTINRDGLIYIEATRVGDESTLAQITKLVQDAQQSKAPIQAYADKVASVFVPSVIAIAVLALSVWTILGYTGAYPLEWRMDGEWKLKGACWDIIYNNAAWSSYKMHTLTPAQEKAAMKACPEYISAFMLSLRFFISCLVVACPCAMGMATPTAVMVGTGKGAKSGVLIKGGEVLEAASTIKALYFDKTGTLTKGQIAISEAEVFKTAQISRKHVFGIVGIVEGTSNHPIAQAVTAYCQEKGNDDVLWNVDKANTIAGKGIECVLSTDYPKYNKKYVVRVGSAKYVKDELDMEQSLATSLNNLYNQGKTVVMCSINDEVVALFGCQDTIKEEAADVLIKLQTKYKIPVHMVTGDNRRAAQYVANQLHIPLENVHAEVLPKDKVRVVREAQEAVQRERMMKKKGRKSKRSWEKGMDSSSDDEEIALTSMDRLNSTDPVTPEKPGDATGIGFVGDGINDAAALTQADVGIAVGAGTEIAMESADVVLIQSNLYSVLSMLSLAQATIIRIRLNFIWAFGYNVLAIPLAVGLLYPITMWQLPPLAAGISMISSSLTVLACSLSLNLWKDPYAKKIQKQKQTKT